MSKWLLLTAALLAAGDDSAPSIRRYRAQDLALAYVANEADVDESFRDQTIEVLGRITQVRRIVVSEPTLDGGTVEHLAGYAAMMIETIREGESHPEVIGIRCAFPIEARKDLAKLKLPTERPICIRGVCRSLSEHYEKLDLGRTIVRARVVELHRCELVPYSDKIPEGTTVVGPTKP